MKSLSERIQKLHFSPRNKVINLLFGQYHSVFKGRGMEFEDLREYMIGDSIKDIDWKSTAKTGNIHIKKYKETRELHILFALDVSSSMQWKVDTTDSRLEQALDFITLVSLLAIAHNDTMGLLLYDTDVKKYVPFKRGNAQLIRMLREVSVLNQTPYWNETNTTNALQFLLNGVKKKTICFLITDSLDCTSHMQLLRALNKKHECVVVYLGEKSFDFGSIKDVLYVQDIETGEVSPIDFQDTETQTAYLHHLQETERKKKQLKKATVELITVTPDDDISFVLYSFLHKQARRKRI